MPRSPARPDDPDARFHQGLTLYLARLPFEAHEAWETLWLAETHPPRKRLLQALIQVAAALHKLHRGDSAAALRLLGRAHDKLLDQPSTAPGQRLQDDITRAQAEITRLAAQGRTDLAPELVPTIDPAIVSFDEPPRG